MDDVIKPDMSPEVTDIKSGKLHQFAPEVIVPLKQKLVDEAVNLHQAIEPCGDRHFNINGDALVFWYNNLSDHSTRMTATKI